VDTLLFLVAAVFGLLVIGGRLESSAPPVPGWLLTADVVAGVLGCAGLWLRRRWPVGLALALVALSTFSEVVAGPWWWRCSRSRCTGRHGSRGASSR
jgi:hypothetical protein